MKVLDLFRLDGKVAMVIGGARHLGFDMADALAEAGASIIVTSRQLTAAETAAKKLETQYGISVLPLALDHSKVENVSEVFQKAIAWQGTLDILINNAGGGSGNSPADICHRNPKDIENLIANNLLGPLFCCQAAAKDMIPAKSGVIINIASIAALVGRDRRMYERSGMRGQPVDYAAAKAGIIGMTRDLAGMLSPYGIRVNAISPGGFARDNVDTFIRDYSNTTPLGRMGQDGLDLKGAALFLASSASAYITGHNLVVDGGFSIWK